MTTNSYNYLTNTSFQLVVSELPKVSFYSQNCGIPQISVANPEMGTPLLSLPVTGDHATFGEFNITFLVDSHLENYYEVFNWIRGYSRLNSTDNIMNFMLRNQTVSGERVKESLLVSDGEMIVMSNLCQIARVKFVNMFPVSLSGLDFTIVVDDVQYQTATATFKYDYYTIVLEHQE